VVALVYVPTNTARGSFPASSPAYLVDCSLDDSHAGWGEVESWWCWICISFTDKDVEHFFMYLLGMAFYSENYLFNSFACLLIGLLIFCCLMF
jgi:hypothetical protein